MTKPTQVAMFAQNSGITKQTLFSYFQKKSAKMNQPIYIRDLFLYFDSYQSSFGETITHSPHYPNETIMSRLVDQVALLANIANEYHQHYYCQPNTDGEYTLKPEYLHHITRLSLSEFSLYPAKPLSIDDFQLFLASVLNIARNQQQNLHLLLSTISVVTEDKQILNVSIYVQCGSDAKLNTYCKTTSALYDFKYNNTINYSQQARYNAKPFDSTEFSISTQGFTICNNSVFRIKTAGGAQYTQAIDICIDNMTQHSFKLMERIARRDINGVDDMIPLQVDHIVTSNSIDIATTNTMTGLIVQIDPCESILSHMDNDSVSAQRLQQLNNPKYVQMTITKSSDGVSVKFPPFSSHFRIVASQERKLAEFSGLLEILVKERNMKAGEYAIETSLRKSL